MVEVQSVGNYSLKRLLYCWYLQCFILNLRHCLIFSSPIAIAPNVLSLLAYEEDFNLLTSSGENFVGLPLVVNNKFHNVLHSTSESMHIIINLNILIIGLENCTWVAIGSTGTSIGGTGGGASR